VIPPPISDVDRYAIRDSTSEIAEDAPVWISQSDTDVYIAEDNIQDSKYIAWKMSDMLKWQTHVSKE
jgi:hypothetical protein